MPVFAENGMSMSGHNCEQTPFCPCLLLNLSPIIGFLTRRRRIFAFCRLLFELAPLTAT
uniref:DNA-directed RNA polymerase I subunit, putative n=1 Tax=Arundo donax TaxID=35708 RepID=A0A0A9CLW6_ARUDO